MDVVAEVEDVAWVAGRHVDLDGRGFSVGLAGSEQGPDLARRECPVVELEFVDQAVKRVVVRRLREATMIPDPKARVPIWGKIAERHDIGDRLRRQNSVDVDPHEADA